jgi:hypothetical protein
VPACNWRNAALAISYQLSPAGVSATAHRVRLISSWPTSASTA